MVLLHTIVVVRLAALAKQYRLRLVWPVFASALPRGIGFPAVSALLVNHASAILRKITIARTALVDVGLPTHDAMHSRRVLAWSFPSFFPIFWHGTLTALRQYPS